MNKRINKMYELPMLVKRCLTHRVEIFPFQLNYVLSQYTENKIPDEPLSLLNELDLKRYVNGLYLCGQEMAGDWTRGHKILEELGFVKKERVEGHRSFISLVWGDTENESEIEADK